MRAVETSLIQRAADALWNADRAGTAIAPVRELLGAATDIGLRYAVEVSSGSGAACLGNPIHAARWLADTLCERGIPLRAGDVVMTGGARTDEADRRRGRIMAIMGDLGSASTRLVAE
jgi:2-keto-4-pentenoate hydratase